MNANEITYGVEIECTIPMGAYIAARIQVGNYHAGVQVPGLPVGWNAQRDVSIRTGRGRVAVEVVSPVLQGADGLRQIQAVCTQLNAWGARVNCSTGLHVHVGVGRDLPRAQLEKIVALVANFETAIYASTGTKSRQRGRYCRPISQSPAHRDGDYDSADRYHVLNVRNLIFGTKPTVEFRAFSGTTNASKIIAWVRLAVGLVERGLEMTRKTNWVAPTPVETSPIHRGGEGQTQVNRLFYQLGWTKGRANRVYGEVGADVKTMRNSKREIVKLAKKYDAAR